MTKSSKNIAAFGIFTTQQDAETCISTLLNSGFTQDDVSILASDKGSSHELLTEKDNKLPEGVTTGATTVGFVGGAIGLLAGLGALAIPGVGPLIAAGPIMGMLAGIGAGAATGGLVGALIGIGLPEYQAKRYEGHMRAGGILVSVHCNTSDDVTQAKYTLKECGANDISSMDEEPVRKAS